MACPGGVVIGLIQTITGTSFKKAEQHRYYFRKCKSVAEAQESRHLPKLPRPQQPSGAVQQQRSYYVGCGTVYDALEDMYR